MPMTNDQAGTRIDEIAPKIFRISTPVPPNSTVSSIFRKIVSFGRT